MELIIVCIFTRSYIWAIDIKSSHTVCTYMLKCNIPWNINADTSNEFRYDYNHSLETFTHSINVILQSPVLLHARRCLGSRMWTMPYTRYSRATTTMLSIQPTRRRRVDPRTGARSARHRGRWDGDREWGLVRGRGRVCCYAWALCSGPVCQHYWQVCLGTPYLLF